MRNPTVCFPMGFAQNTQIINGQTYKKVKRNMRSYLKESYINEVSVYRERRGEWGEWFENWQLVNNKPKIIKQGWM